MRFSSRKGFALPMAIGSMVVIGMILAGVFFSATQENRVGQNMINQERAFRAAEYGLNNTYANWNSGTMNSLATGGVAVLGDSDATRKWRDTVRVTRLNNNTYWIVSTGYAGSSYAAARHRTGAALRVAFPDINFLAALTVHGTLKIGGSSLTNGNDTPPAGWADCPPLSTSKPGVAVDDTLNHLNFSGCNNLNCITGTPKLLQTPAVNDTNTFFKYGPDADWTTLTASANLVLPGGQTYNGPAPSYNADGSCRLSNQNNWGDPTRSNPTKMCESYFPIIYFTGKSTNTHITGGVGQGIMLVDGDLQVDGGFEWFGPVIVRGHITTQGTGGHFTGAVMAADVDLELNEELGNALIQYSSCSISKALIGAGIPKLLASRGWAELY